MKQACRTITVAASVPPVMATLSANAIEGETEILAVTQQDRKVQIRRCQIVRRGMDISERDNALVNRVP